MSGNDHKNSGYADQTKLTHIGREYAEHGMINPAVYHASTITVPNLEIWLNKSAQYTYGRSGTPTLRALEDAVSVLEGGYRSCLFPSGKAAISSTLLSFLKPGDQLLMTDSVYQPTREFCDGLLTDLGIKTVYYDPLIGSAINQLITPKTKMIFLESPGSLTMEMQDVPAIVEIAKQNDVLTVIDNTWGAGLNFKPLSVGCDISLQAGTKYIVGHSDVMLGTATTTKRLWPQLRKHYLQLGQHVGPDDVYMALRGLRTMDVRLERHMKNTMIVANWLQNHTEVAAVMYPALPGDAGHDIWKRDFSGACGLFSIRLKNPDRARIAAMIDDFSLFGIGASWGGYESLVLPFDPSTYRTATQWPYEGINLRFHIGLEDPQDLIADLQAGFERMSTIS